MPLPTDDDGSCQSLRVTGYQARGVTPEPADPPRGAPLLRLPGGEAEARRGQATATAPLRSEPASDLSCLEIPPPPATTRPSCWPGPLGTGNANPGLASSSDIRNSLKAKCFHKNLTRRDPDSPVRKPEWMPSSGQPGFVPRRVTARVLLGRWRR